MHLKAERDGFQSSLIFMKLDLEYHVSVLKFYDPENRKPALVQALSDTKSNDLKNNKTQTTIRTQIQLYKIANFNSAGFNLSLLWRVILPTKW